MITLMSKSYYAENGKKNPRLIANVLGKNQNSMSWVRYLGALNRSIDTVTNTEFQFYEQEIMTYTQNKLASQHVL